jgi:hypothetical protein
MSATTTEYSNKLEQWYNQCPGPVKTVLNIGNAYKTLDQWLKYVAGDPEKLVSYGPRYVELSHKLEAIATDVTGATSSIGGWYGESYAAFMKKTSDFSDKVSKTAKAIAGTQEILVACAKGCVQVANCIVDLVKMFIEWLIKSFLAALASSWCSFGATVAAWLGANIMKAIELLSKVMGICQKLGTLIEKIVTLLKKVMEIVQKIQKIIQVIKSVFAAFKAFKNGDFLGGISSLSGAVSGYNSLSGGSSTSTLGTWNGTANQVAGAVTAAKNGNYSGLVSAVGNATGAGSTVNKISALWQSSGVAGDATGTWNAIQQARTAAAKNSPS